MSAHDGGPAFPCERERGERLDSAPGMTLRDYFAAKVLAALISEPQWSDQSQGLMPSLSSPETLDVADRYACAAYRLADAMLKERAK